MVSKTARAHTHTRASNNVGNRGSPLHMPKEPHSRPRDNMFRVKLMWQMSESTSLLSLPKTQPLIFILLRAYAHVPPPPVPNDFASREHLKACGQGPLSNR